MMSWSWAMPDYNGAKGASQLRSRPGLNPVSLVGLDAREWPRPVFDASEGELGDYPLNNLGWRICSSRMRKAVDAARTGREAGGLTWLPVTVFEVAKEPRDFFVMHFPMFPEDLLDKSRTVFGANGNYIKPVLRAAALQHYAIAGRPNDGAFFCDAVVTQALAGLRGLYVRPAIVSPDAPN